jgi:hypothetical protein
MVPRTVIVMIVKYKRKCGKKKLLIYIFLSYIFSRDYFPKQPETAFLDLNMQVFAVWKKKVAYLGGAQFLIHFKVGPL